VKGQIQGNRAINKFLTKDRDRIDVLKEAVVKQNEYGPFKKHTAKQIAESATKSARELTEALNTDQAMNVASNMGDLVYLLLRLSGKTDIDLKETVMMKLARNAYKYNNILTKEEGLALYKSFGGDEAFFEKYVSIKGKDQFERWHIEEES
jgi:phosphoribosyl-ATP pyrophosphohydrolase